jgi:hypothetical protein
MSFAFWTAAITLLTFGVAIAAPLKSGPFCVDDCVGYPFTDIAAYIPRDFLWIYPLS